MARHLKPFDPRGAMARHEGDPFESEFGSTPTRSSYAMIHTFLMTGNPRAIHGEVADHTRNSTQERGLVESCHALPVSDKGQ